MQHEAGEYVNTFRRTCYCARQRGWRRRSEDGSDASKVRVDAASEVAELACRCGLSAVILCRHGNQVLRDDARSVSDCQTATAMLHAYESSIRGFGVKRLRKKICAYCTVDRKALAAFISPVGLSRNMAARGANKLVKLGWIGAGGINFGSLEGPWNHAVRMQKQNSVQFTAIVDPNVSAAQVICEATCRATLTLRDN